MDVSRPSSPGPAHHPRSHPRSFSSFLPRFFPRLFSLSLSAFSFARVCRIVHSFSRFLSSCAVPLRHQRRPLRPFGLIPLRWQPPLGGPRRPRPPLPHTPHSHADLPTVSPLPSRRCARSRDLFFARVSNAPHTPRRFLGVRASARRSSLLGLLARALSFYPSSFFPFLSFSRLPRPPKRGARNAPLWGHSRSFSSTQPPTAYLRRTKLGSCFSPFADALKSPRLCFSRPPSSDAHRSSH